MSFNNPDSAISIPFAELPSDVYIKGPKYKIIFDRIQIPIIMPKKYASEEEEILDILAHIDDPDYGKINDPWSTDIRQILSDNAIKDMIEDLDNSILRLIS